MLINEQATKQLFEAVEKGDIIELQKSIDKGADVNALYPDGDSLLHKAAARSLYFAKPLLDSKEIDVNCQGRNGDTLLHRALKKGSTDTVKALLEVKGIKLDLQDNEGKTLLHTAAIKGMWGSEKIIKPLINAGANVNIKDNTGKTALDIAKERGETKIVNILRGGRNKALLKDIMEGNLSGAREAIESGANGDKFGDIPLHMAVSKGNVEIVKLLLEGEGISIINRADKYGDKPLHIAVREGNVKIVELLLKVEGIDINRANKRYGFTSLHMAVRRGNVEIVKLLLEKGININRANKHGDTSLLLVMVIWKLLNGF
ncbi:ankyrin repeat domain-containing protein [Wolbachia endosymbiont (group E) of Neria commutata]|uniref:ankyrin repeat domain-containing protein n=1 Tax=Wolbachia endosymbiont (group E) of Neria commutata TaxID=3066149 RepID=UPI003132D14A